MLQNQLNTEYKEDAEDCIAIYQKLKEMYNGHVWNSQWRVLVDITFIGFPSGKKRFKPSAIGYVFLEGIKNI